MPKLDSADIQKKLSGMRGWELNEQRIEKKFTFSNFSDAVCFFNQVAEIAEEENHHPDLHLTAYKHLKIELSTHSEGGVTKKDLDLAGKIEQIKR